MPVPDAHPARPPGTPGETGQVYGSPADRSAGERGAPPPWRPPSDGRPADPTPGRFPALGVPDRPATGRAAPFPGHGQPGHPGQSP
ncbi:RDD family protein, partial [Micromonospora phytophila]|nr:RDD family protein [Micromonospora phytophila]